MPFRLVLINDASTDERIRPHMLEHKRPQDLYLENSENLGFVQSANRGMSQSSAEDVVLLNSDTRVYAKWLVNLFSAIFDLFV